jgi:hypothetical protein
VNHIVQSALPTQTVFPVLLDMFLITTLVQRTVQLEPTLMHSIIVRIVRLNASLVHNYTAKSA